MLQAQLGAPVPLAFEAHAGSEAEPVPASASIAEVAEQNRRERLQQITDGAIAHPVVQSATRILGGEVKKVVPLIPTE